MAAVQLWTFELWTTIQKVNWYDLTASNKIFRSGLITVIGLITCYNFIKHVDRWFVFDSVILLIIATIAIIIFLWTIYKDRKDYSESKKLIDFIPTFIGSGFLFGLLITIFFLYQRDSSPSKFYCVTKIIDFNGAAIDFREDGTYKLSSWCMGTDYYRGTYTMKDSIITLDKSEIEKVIESNRLVVRPEMEIYGKDGIRGKDTVYHKSVYQIDKNGNVIDTAIDFILIDNKWNETNF